MLSNALDALHRTFRSTVDLLVPHECFVCGRESACALVCEVCERDLPPLGPACPVCAVPTADGACCGECLRSPPAFDATRALFSYGFPLDRMVKALKYRYRLAVAHDFAERLARSGPPAGIDVLLPMPLHVQRLSERGFNQAVEIARPLARAWGLPLELARVVREVAAPPQASLPWTQRKTNMRGVFRCRGRFDGATVLVIDDVMTTGATLDELAGTLKRYGACRVENLVVARTPPPG